MSASNALQKAASEQQGRVLSALIPPLCRMIHGHGLADINVWQFDRATHERAFGLLRDSYRSGIEWTAGLWLEAASDLFDRQQPITRAPAEPSSPAPDLPETCQGELP